MGGQQLNCPLSLCCNKTFSSKQLLLEHLSSVIENLYCPICKNKWTSLVHLIAHLGQDNCEPDDTVHIFDPNGDNIENSTNVINSDIKVFDENEINTSNAASHFATEHTYGAPVDPKNDKMYVELFSKSSKPCLQTRELKLVKTMNGESRYMIVSQDDTELNAESTIVTKQNTDGTISLTTVKDMKLEIENEPIQPEIYSCNSCKVSFSSLIEHIQNYHNDQDVVVEEPIEEGDSEMFPERFPIEYGALVGEDPLVTGDRQTPRRVITDTGDIVEEPLIFKTDAVVQQEDPIAIDTIQLQPVKVEDKQGRMFTRRYVQIDKLGDSINKNVTPTEKVKYPCPHCAVVYENSKSLCAHMKAHKIKSDGIPEASDEPIAYECGICCTVFPTNKSLKLHKRMHDPIKSRPIELPVENIDGSEVSENRYLCHICNKMIPEDYKAIHQNSHKTSNKMNCGICNKKFTSLEYLEMHMNIHNMDKVPVNRQDQSLPYNCLYCNRRFARPHEKVKHERIHTGEKPHSCEICGKSFRVSYCLTLHMRTHTGARPYACPHCGKRFKAHSVYNHHLLTHSEVRAYKCPYCPKAFKTSVQLSGHKNSHTKPFSCQQCNRPFASLYAVRVHTETHSRQNNLKFCCELCGASYARAFALKDHIKQVHKQEEGASPTRVIPPDEDWMMKENPDTEGMSLNKDLTQEITDLEMTSNELIVP